MDTEGLPLITPAMINSAEALKRVRDNGGVQYVNMGGREAGWLVTEHGAASRALADPRMTGAPATSFADRARPEDDLPDEEDLFFLPEPESTRLRRLIIHQLNHRRMANLEPKIQAEVDALLDALPRHEPVDFAEAFARPLPVAVLCELLGIPRSRRSYVRDYIYGWVGQDAGAAAITMSADRDMVAYLRTLIADRISEGDDDMVSAMVRSEDSPAIERDVLSAVRMLLVGGNRPVSRLLLEGLAVLHSPRDRWEQLVANPDQLESTVEELLRFITPSSMSSRYADSDAVFEGKAVPKGVGVHCALVAVNRDPALFHDPDTFDTQRGTNPHLAFGLGRKHCPGAALARAEARIAFGTLIRRFPHLHVLEGSGSRTMPIILGQRHLDPRYLDQR